MFTFPQIDPETSGRVMQIPIPLDKYLGASFDQGEHDSAFNSIMRMEELHLDNVDESSPMLDPVTATKKYGVGDLKFDQPVREATASAMSERKKNEMDRQFYLSQGASAGRFLPGMAASMIGGVSNPLDLGLMFVPFVGEERMAAKVAEVGGSTVSQMLARGLITQESIAALKIPVPRLVGAAVQGGLNQSLFEIPNLAASMQDKADYGFGDAARNIVGGGILSAAMHSAGAIFSRLSRGTKDAMSVEAMNQFLRDEDIRVDKYVQLDEETIKNNVKFDEDLSRKRAIDSIDENKLKAAVFNQFHEEPKQAAVMLTDEDGNSQVYNGAFHGDAWGKVPKEDFDKVGSGKMTAVEGFTTDTGRFVSRDEAAQMLGINEHLTSEAMHGTSDESFLSEEEHHIFNHYLEEGRTRPDAWNKTMAYRYQNKERFFFDRPDIHEKLNEERQRQTDSFVENERAKYDPQAKFSEAVRTEIQKQQSEGRILTQDQINKYLPADKPFAEQSGEMLTKDVQNIKENLKNKEVPAEGEAKKPDFTPDEEKMMESVPKSQKSAIEIAADCLLKKMI